MSYRPKRAIVEFGWERGAGIALGPFPIRSPTSVAVSQQVALARSASVV